MSSETADFLKAFKEGLEKGFESGFKKGKEYEHRWWSEHCASCTDADRPQTWIPCSERLPEETADYLCWVVNPYDESIQYHLVCAWYAGAKEWSPYDETASSNVVAWMPLPKLWKGADDEMR